MESDDIDTYTRNITDAILMVCNECIPNKTVRIRPSEPPWITTYIKKMIRKRKRAYKRAKRSQLPQHFIVFKRLRNDTITAINKAKKEYIASRAVGSAPLTKREQSFN